MKNCKKMNAGFVPRIFTIALVTMLTATTLWAKPKNTVEYTPFKSENPNATVFECECIEGYPGGLTLSGRFIDLRYGNKLVDCSSIAIYGWKKKKGGWEKLGEYQPKENYFNASVLDNGNYKYTHYAVEAEIPENSMTLSVEGRHRYGEWDLIEICLQVSEEYEKLFYEKRDAERAEQERLAKEAALKELFNKCKTADTELKKKSKGYEFHGISESYRTYRLLKGKSLSNGHAYVSMLRFSNDFSRAEFYENEFLYNNFVDVYKGSVYLQYADNSLREQIVLLKIKSNDEVWFCYTPNSSGGITILGFTVTKDHDFFYGVSEKNLTLYAEWLSQGN